MNKIIDRLGQNTGLYDYIDKSIDQVNEYLSCNRLYPEILDKLIKVSNNNVHNIDNASEWNGKQYLYTTHVWDPAMNASKIGSGGFNNVWLYKDTPQLVFLEPHDIIDGNIKTNQQKQLLFEDIELLNELNHLNFNKRFIVTRFIGISHCSVLTKCNVMLIFKRYNIDLFQYILKNNMNSNNIKQITNMLNQNFNVLLDESTCYCSDIKLNNILVEFEPNNNTIFKNILLHDFSIIFCVLKNNTIFKNSNLFDLDVKKLHLIYYKFILYLENLYILKNFLYESPNINNCLYYDYFKKLDYKDYIWFKDYINVYHNYEIWFRVIHSKFKDYVLNPSSPLKSLYEKYNEDKEEEEKIKEIKKSLMYDKDDDNSYKKWWWNMFVENLPNNLNILLHTTRETINQYYTDYFKKKYLKYKNKYIKLKNKI